jgi:anti-sigma-K factor RskA
MTTESCQRVEELLALASVDALEQRDIDVDINAHLATCGACRQTAAAFFATVAALPETLPQQEPPARLRRNLMATVYGEAGGTVSTRRDPLLRRIWGRVPVGRGFTVATVLAAITVVTLAVWTATRSVTSQPQQASFQVAGTTAEPSATGQLSYDPLTERAVLTVQGLPTLSTSSPERVYEVWLIPASGAPVPAAFLTLQPDGRTWTAVISGDVLAYRTVAATVEPEGGSPAPTGVEVVSGSVG